MERKKSKQDKKNPTEDIQPLNGLNVMKFQANFLKQHIENLDEIIEKIKKMTPKAPSSKQSREDTLE